MMETERDWCIVQVKTHREEDVRHLLDEAGLRTYLPLIRRRVIRFGKKLTLLTPMFPGYVFVQGVSDGCYNLVRYCRGVLRILGAGQGVWLLDNMLVEEIMSREVDGVVQLMPVLQTVCAGDPVVVTEGPFEGWQGIFQDHVGDGDRVRILLTHVRFSTRLVVPKTSLATGNGSAIR
jgi:transcriptional antiterminator RfaH